MVLSKKALCSLPSTAEDNWKQRATKENHSSNWHAPIAQRQQTGGKMKHKTKTKQKVYTGIKDNLHKLAALPLETTAQEGWTQEEYYRARN